ncbi:cytochrome P450 family protein [Streptomyces sp. NPDC003470]|uniref:cytochrome P450 family protein n=1 Tax=Streptomyces sp. NPDC127100 TaxID=3347138 RepID=UPI00364E7303
MKGYPADPDPYPNYRWLRANAPACPMGGDTAEESTCFVTSYELVRAGLLDSRLSSDPRNAAGADPSAPAERSVLDSDPPDHGRMRRVVNPAFSLTAVDALRPTIARICREAIAGLAGHGRADLMAEYGLVVPVAVIHEILGVPPEQRVDPVLFMDRFWWAAAAREPDPEAAEFIDAYVTRILEYKRAHPGDDVTTALLRALEDGGLRDESELRGMVTAVLGAGHTTTVPLVSAGIVRMLQHPAQRAKAMADSARWADVVEELLRHDSVIQVSTNRYAVEDLVIGDVPVPRGGTVLMSFAAANRDPARFDDPDVFDMDRPRGGHLAFGHGTHFCLGAHLGRAEAEIALRLLFETLGDVRLTVPVEDVVWSFGPMLRGPAAIPVTFTPVGGARQGARA